MADFKKRLGTFLLGGAVGALAGLFLAPKSGKDLRDTIISRTEEAAERGREAYFETQDRVAERVAEVRDQVFSQATPSMDEAQHEMQVDEPPDKDAFEDAVNAVNSVTADDEAPGQKEPLQAPEPYSSGKSEELLKKIEETRARLRQQLKGSPAEDNKEE